MSQGGGVSTKSVLQKLFDERVTALENSYLKEGKTELLKELRLGINSNGKKPFPDCQDKPAKNCAKSSPNDKVSAALGPNVDRTVVLSSHKNQPDKIVSSDNKIEVIQAEVIAEVSQTDSSEVTETPTKCENCEDFLKKPGLVAYEPLRDRRITPKELSIDAILTKLDSCLKHERCVSNFAQKEGERYHAYIARVGRESIILEESAKEFKRVKSRYIEQRKEFLEKTVKNHNIEKPVQYYEIWDLFWTEKICAGLLKREVGKRINRLKLQNFEQLHFALHAAEDAGWENFFFSEEQYYTNLALLERDHIFERNRLILSGDSRGPASILLSAPESQNQVSAGAQAIATKILRHGPEPQRPVTAADGVITVWQASGAGPLCGATYQLRQVVVDTGAPAVGGFCRKVDIQCKEVFPSREAVRIRVELKNNPNKFVIIEKAKFYKTKVELGSQPDPVLDAFLDRYIAD